jgi:prophage tail gpP-like protein
MDPFIIAVAGAQLKGWTHAKLTRKRDHATGELSFSVFFDGLPGNPPMNTVTPGAQIQVYVAGNLAFTGTLDSRKGQAKAHKHGQVHDSRHHDRNGQAKGIKGKDAESAGSGSGRSVAITPDSYEIHFSARGTCKDIVDCSHAHATGQIKNATPIQAIKALLAPYGIEAVDQANLTDSIDRTFTDGGIVSDEIHDIVMNSAASIFESTQGQLIIANHGASGSGDDLILGQNILAFSAEQTEEPLRSDIKIKGNRTGKAYGAKAIQDPIQTLNVASVKRFRHYAGQINGDGTTERVKAAARNEAASRAQAAKTVKVEVFHVQTPSGTPWDINTTHYTEVPTENIFDEFVVTELTYDVSPTELKTSLTLAPAAAVDEGGGSTSMVSDAQAIGQARRAQLGTAYGLASYPSPWSDTSGTFLSPDQIAALGAAVAVAAPPPLTLPGASS